MEKKLQSMRILVSFWKNQTVFALTGTTKEEQLGIGFEARRETIIKQGGEAQKKFLGMLLSENYPILDNLRAIWAEISKMANAVSDDAMDKGLAHCQLLVDSIQEDIKWCQKQLQN
ncbi:MAG: hypothetical protein E7018_03600 [Alphaproteobacteria bacterium]|nr:hypothetical protein [Alphaproteobacteria bacterium]